MVQLMPLHPKTPSSLASFKSRQVLPFWYRLTQAVLEKRPLMDVVVVVVFRVRLGLKLGTGVLGWLGSRLVSLLDSSAEESGFKSQSRR